MQIYLQFCSRKDPSQGLMSESIEYLNFFLKPSMASWPQNICRTVMQNRRKATWAGQSIRAEHEEKIGRFVFVYILSLSSFRIISKQEVHYLSLVGYIWQLFSFAITSQKWRKVGVSSPHQCSLIGRNKREHLIGQISHVDTLFWPIKWSRLFWPIRELLARKNVDVHVSFWARYCKRERPRHSKKFSK